MRISAKMTGMTEFERMTKNLVKRDTYEKPLEQLVMEVAVLARMYAPRDTGDLEDSITVKKLGFGKFAVISTVPYSEYMEFGTIYFPVGTAESPRARTSTSGKACFHPFLRSASYQKINEFPDMIKNIIFGVF